MGRPAVNTALNNAFNPDDTSKNAAKDAYNAESDMTLWAAHSTEIGKNLAILDSLDMSCGNQLLSDTTKTDATRYGTLAGALADDRLYIDTSSATCAQYLAVEANATNAVVNTDCGGRKLTYDVIDTTYSVLAAGVLSGVDDGVSANDATVSDTFPYLAEPH
jgi:hypothetical protein